MPPEAYFPAALDDCMTTLTWMRDHAAELGIDPERIAVAGSSAGGGLSAAVAQRAHDDGISLRAQLLVYPMIDDRTTLTENHCGRGKFLWTPQSNRFAWTAYLGDRVPQIYLNSVKALQPTRFFVLSGTDFAGFVKEHFPMPVHLLEGVFYGQQKSNSAIAQRERLLALGSLSAGLTHELNNPASATLRAASPISTCMIGYLRFSR